MSDNKKNKNIKNAKKGEDRYSLSNEDMKEIVADPRFAHVSFDSKYSHAPSYKRKTEIDKRFKSVLKSKNITKHIVQDPRGRPVNFRNKDSFSKLYTLSSSTKETQNDDNENSDSSDNQDSDSDNDNSDSTDDKNSSKVISPKKLVSATEENGVPKEFLDCLLDENRDIARGDNFFSDDSSDDDSSSSDEEDDIGEFEWGLLDTDAKWDNEEEQIEETRRFAVCNMDWDQVKCLHLMVLFSSFVPPTGKVVKVSLFLSDFGRERLKEEEEKGPEEIIKLAQKKQNSIEDSELEYLKKVDEGIFEDSDKPGGRYLDALRRYQRNKLKYYYAVVECDSVETAKVVYSECDQQPFETVGVNLDLRYVPDDMDFTDTPEDEVTGIPENYSSEGFFLNTIHDTNPRLTWDETDNSRKHDFSSAMAKPKSKKDVKDINILSKYVANSSDDEEEKEEEEESVTKNRKNKYKELIEALVTKKKKRDDDDDDDIDKEIKFELEEELSSNQSVNSEEEEIESKKKQNKSKDLKLKKKKGQRKKASKKASKAEIEGVAAFSDDELPEDLQQSRVSPKIKKSKKQKKKKTIQVEEEPSKKCSEGDLELMFMDDLEDDKKHFNMREITTKSKNNENKSKFKINKEDPRFASLLSGEFNIDPLQPQFKKTEAMAELSKDLKKKRKTESLKQETSMKRQKVEDDDLSSLVKKIKMKTKNKNIS